MTNVKDGVNAWLRSFRHGLVSLRTACANSYRRSFAATTMILVTSSKLAAAPHDMTPFLTEAEWSRLINALIIVESRGRDTAHNKKEDARGCLQIRAGVVADYCLYNPRITHDEVFRREVAIRVCRWYLEFYGRRYWQKWGHDERRTKQEILARIWNGGPSGMSKLATIGYWNTVRNFL